MDTTVLLTTDAASKHQSALRESMPTEAAALWDAAAVARDEVWRQLLARIGEAVREVERACAAPVGTPAGPGDERVSALAGRLLDAAARDTDEAVQRARAEVARDVAEAERRLDAVSRVLDDTRRELGAAAEQLEQERGRRQRAEAERDDQIRVGEQIAREYESRLQAAQHERDAALADGARLAAGLEKERAAHERLRSAVQTVQQIVFESDGRPPSAKGEAPVLQLIASKPAAAAADDEPVAPSAPTAPKAQDSQYAEELLDHIQSIYDSDTAIGRPATELVDKLTRNLAYAATAFTRRVGGAPASRALFAQEVAIRLDRSYQNAFGRHLAMAMYEYEQSRANDAAGRRNAS